ncbi:hypothetical protein [uncultured Desulfovibrio sp.]|uniref:hypothetical protein n=1 Tax=uncultured Desulfovibrio sp. TaxID=167968 RepID=UPI002633DC86|nr:hypothetical protein [uncultured Desulfovibrio sp.]
MSRRAGQHDDAEKAGTTPGDAKAGKAAGPISFSDSRLTSSDGRREWKWKTFDKPWSNGYRERKDDNMKRIADWLEKISAGSMLIGLFQNNLWAIAVGIGALVGSVYISRRFL